MHDICVLAQTALLDGAKPFSFILYADKTKLSSFGTVKGYPVVARCANLPVHIRNSNGVRGGRVVGWLPIVRSHAILTCLTDPELSFQVEEDPEESKKTAFINFKHVVWHEAFYVLLKTVISHSKTRYWVECADKVTCQLFPVILILSADYKEQYAFLLTVI